jgi:hypothetical protein
MSRTQKLYERLDRIETHYSSLLQAELEAVLRGGLGHYLGSKLRDDWHRAMSSSPDSRATELESLEKEIRQLRLKLGEPGPGTAVSVAHALVQRIKGAGQWSPGTNKAWLREAIDDLSRQDSQP